MKVKITITLEGEYAEALTNDLRAFAEQSPEFKESVIDNAVNFLEVTANVPDQSLRKKRKVLAIGCAILRHIDSLEVTPITE